MDSDRPRPGEGTASSTPAAKRRKKSRAPDESSVLSAVKQEHPEFSRSSSEEAAEEASREGHPQVTQTRLEAERRARAELQARLKEEEKTLAQTARVPHVVPARIHVPAFATSAGLGQNAAVLALPARRAECERMARLELQTKLEAESKALLEERAKVEKVIEKAKAAEALALAAKAKSGAKAAAEKEAKEAKEVAKEIKDHQAKEAKEVAKEIKDHQAKEAKEAKEAKATKVKAKAKVTKIVEAKAGEAAKTKAAATAGVRKDDAPLVSVKQEQNRSRSASFDAKGKKTSKASAAKAKAAPAGQPAGHVVKPKAAAGADSMVLVEIVFKNTTKKVNHKASTKISELHNWYEPKIRAKQKDLGALRVCDGKGVEQGSEVTLGLLRDSEGSQQAVRLVFEEDDWLS